MPGRSSRPIAVPARSVPRPASLTVIVLPSWTCESVYGSSQVPDTTCLPASPNCRAARIKAARLSCGDNVSRASSMTRHTAPRVWVCPPTGPAASVAMTDQRTAYISLLLAGKGAAARQSGSGAGQPQGRLDGRGNVVPAKDQKILRPAVHRDHHAVRERGAECGRGRVQAVRCAGAAPDHRDLT